MKKIRRAFNRLLKRRREKAKRVFPFSIVEEQKFFFSKMDSFKNRDQEWYISLSHHSTTDSSPIRTKWSKAIKSFRFIWATLLTDESRWIVDSLNGQSLRFAKGKWHYDFLSGRYKLFCTGVMKVIRIIPHRLTSVVRYLLTCFPWRGLKRPVIV